MAIGGYSSGGYWCLLIGIILVFISGYFINGHWWLLRCKRLVVIDGYFIIDDCIISYCLIFFVIIP
jgi:hypothetical protein